MRFKCPKSSSFRQNPSSVSKNSAISRLEVMHRTQMPPIFRCRAASWDLQQHTETVVATKTIKAKKVGKVWQVQGRRAIISLTLEV